MRVAIVAVAAALAVALFLLLTMDPAPQSGADRATARAPRAPASDALATDSEADPAGDAASAGTAAADVAASGAPPAELPGDTTAETLAERYRQVAESARQRVAQLPPAVGVGGRTRPQPRGPLHRPFERPGPDMPEGVRRAWEEHVGSLLYPPGHPREGQPLDHVTAEDLANAAATVAESLLPGGMIDAPRRRLPLQVDFMTFHRVKRLNPGGQALADALEEMPRNPAVPLQDPYWIETEASDPKATTLRDYYRERGLDQAEALLARRNASGD